MRNFQYPGRSPVHSTEGMAATSHPLATQTAIAMLRKGGNALDAAVAAAAVQCVVEPGSTGIGGDCFCLYAPAGVTDKMIGYNGSGRAPKAATTDWFAEQGITEIERQSPHAITIPGAVDAWCQLVNDYGRLALGDILAPAITYAREGYPLSARVRFDFAAQYSLLQTNPMLAKTFLVGGKLPPIATRLYQPLLAHTLEAIAQKGRAGFYRGAVAEDMLTYLRSQGGLHTPEDFETAHGEYVAPISNQFRRYNIHQCPPNSQGVIALLLLNIMAGFGLEQDVLSTQRIHQEIEAGRLAYQDRYFYVSDPAQTDVPLEWLLSAEHAAELRATIDPTRAIQDLPRFTAPRQRDTVYIAVVDRDRNVCSLINSLFDEFGSGLMAPKSGVVFHNRGMSFSLDPQHPNCIAPGKRPLHTIIPGMVSHNGKVVLSYGVMGGHYQPFGHLQFLTRFFDYGCDIQAAQDLPRFFPDPITGAVEVEERLSKQTQQQLIAMGHLLVPPPKPIGGSQAIWIDWEEGVLSGGSDPRKDGCAIGY